MSPLVGPAEPAPLRVDRWPGERMLGALVWLSALAIWVALAMSIVGIVYALFLGAFFFVTHLAFITHLRGSAVRLGPDQIPELHRRVQEIAARLAMQNVPAAYVVQAGGALNALATRFLRTHFLVLFSDLLDACGDNEEARDFIVAHELGHVKAGHLRWHWLRLPGLMVPFLGGAYSRAREFTCDRYGHAATGGSDRALEGLCILAAGGRYGRRVNRSVLAAQREDLNGAWMTVGRWLATHPPIAHRLAALDPSLVQGSLSTAKAVAGALLIVVLALGVPTAAFVAFAVGWWPKIQEAIRAGQAQTSGAGAPADPAGTERADPRYDQARTDILVLAQVAATYSSQAKTPPLNQDALYAGLQALRPDGAEPRDPFTGKRYFYSTDGTNYRIWTPGVAPLESSDDLYYASAEAAP